MKIRHIEKQAKMFPSLIGLPGEKSSEQEVAGAWAMNEDELAKTGENLTPIDEKNKMIENQNRVIEDLKNFQKKATEELDKTKTENSIMKQKINFTRRATEERIFENISNPESFREDPLLVAVLSATLNEEELDIEDLEADDNISKPEQDDKRSRKDLFLLSSLDSKIDQSDSIQQERLSHIKNQVIEKMKITRLSRRSLSNSSTKRRLSLLGTEDVRSRSRPRVDSPPASQQ